MLHQPFYLLLDDGELQAEVILSSEYFKDVAEPQTTPHYEIGCPHILANLPSPHNVAVLCSLNQQMKLVSLFG
jgi:hypothetical protein